MWSVYLGIPHFRFPSFATFWRSCWVNPILNCIYQLPSFRTGTVFWLLLLLSLFPHLLMDLYFVSRVMKFRNSLSFPWEFPPIIANLKGHFSRLFRLTKTESPAFLCTYIYYFILLNSFLVAGISTITDSYPKLLLHGTHRAKLYLSVFLLSSDSLLFRLLRPLRIT